MKTRPGIRRLSRDFLLQAIYISIAAVLGVIAVAIVLERVVSREALRGEAEYYAERLASDPAAALPDTRNLTGYRASTGVPEDLRSLGPGFHTLPDSPGFGLVHVSDIGDDRLYLGFDNRSVRELVLAFGIVPLAAVLVVLYVALYSAYRVSRRAVSPVIALADQVRSLDPSDPDRNVFTLETPQDEDIRVLSEALNDFSERLGAFAEREKDFTRDASHELRSPLTIIRMAADTLELNPSLNDSARMNVARIRQAAEDMEELTNAFLLLARQSNEDLPDEYVLVNEVAAEEVERTRLLTGAKSVEIGMEAGNELVVAAAPKVLGSVIGNLLRNGLRYTDEGRVTAIIDGDTVTIADTGPGIAEDQVEKILSSSYRGAPPSRSRGGHGVGLTIVKRLCERFGWPLGIQSELGVGTRVSIRFPDAEIN
ncbi:MAG: HAMP domain-containing sensor histidine kinase [Gammaproteobacteria bacterium]